MGSARRLAALVGVVGLLTIGVAGPGHAVDSTGRLPSGISVWTPVKVVGYTPAGVRRLVVQRDGRSLRIAMVVVWADDDGSVEAVCATGQVFRGESLVLWPGAQGAETWRVVDGRIKARHGSSRTTFARTSWQRAASSVPRWPVTVAQMKSAASGCLS